MAHWLICFNCQRLHPLHSALGCSAAAVNDDNFDEVVLKSKLPVLVSLGRWLGTVLTVMQLIHVSVKL